MTKMSEPILPKRKWTKRDYPFKDMQVGDSIFVWESQKYFRSAASNYFRDRPTKDYTTETVIRNGRKGILLTRMK